MNAGVLDEAAARAAPRSVVGGKAASLARVSGVVPVPAFRVLTTALLEEHLAANAIAWPGGSDAEAVRSARDRIREAPAPPAVARAVAAAYDAVAPASGLVAVRSSGAEEDGRDASFAGSFLSVLGVPDPEAAVTAVRACWASSLSDAALAHRAARGGAPASRPSFAVVVQEQVVPDKAGVLFTVHPFEPDAAVIEANYGTGESVVGGISTPDSVTLRRSDGSVAGIVVGTKRRMTALAPGGGTAVLDVAPERRRAAVLSDAEARALLELGLRAEQLLGAPQDVEWAIDARGPWILQARPVTARVA